MEKMDNIGFYSAEQALMWATEVLRHRRYPKISNLYREIPFSFSSTAKERSQSPEVPSESQDKYTLAMDIYKAMTKLSAEEQKLLMLYLWGDYASELRLRKATIMQTHLKEKGLRAHLSYKYSFREVGRILGKDHKTVAKYVRIAMRKIITFLEEKSLIFEEDMPVPDKTSMGGKVDFRNLS